MHHKPIEHLVVVVADPFGELAEPGAVEGVDEVESERHLLREAGAHATYKGLR